VLRLRLRSLSAVGRTVAPWRAPGTGGPTPVSGPRAGSRCEVAEYTRGRTRPGACDRCVPASPGFC